MAGGVTAPLQSTGHRSRAQLKVRTQLVQQAKTLGNIGVNLVYACFYHTDDKEKFIESLIDNLDKSSLEVDMIRVLP